MWPGGSGRHPERHHEDNSRRLPTVPFAPAEAIPSAPPLPRPLQRARDAATRLFSRPSRPPSPHEEAGFVGGGRARFASLSATENATASHKTGLEINTIAINESGTHALIGGKEIFKTVRVEDGTCAEEHNLRSTIRSTPTQASGKTRQVYSIDIADVAWAKGDFGDYVAAATSSGKIILYDLGHAGLQAAQLHEHFRQVHKVTFNPHRGSLLLSGSQDGTVRLWDVRDVRQASTLRSKHKYSGQADGIRDVKWSPTEGVDFAFGTDSGWIQRWDMRNLKTAKVKVPAHTTTCNTIDWHPDGKHLVSASSDQTVRVWDFSVTKRQKASWEIKTPYPVLNARWRPPCESSTPNDQGARHCTQLVTAYDSSHPVMHIWDFRRPALPFREMSPYPTAPTDLLWHSQDLLWTVGREGVFLQADIQHAQKVIDKRNLQALALSPLGDINFVAQKRRVKRLPTVSSALQSKSSSLSQSPEHAVLGRSWADDSIDHCFLSAYPEKRRVPTNHKSRAQSLSMAPLSKQPSFEMPSILLDNILHNCKSFPPMQAAVRGVLTGINDARTFEDLAHNLKIDPKSAYSAEDFLQTFQDLMDHNEERIKTAGLYRAAQAWRMLTFVAISRLKERAAAKEKWLRDGKPSSLVFPKQVSLSQIARMLLQFKSPEPTPSSMKPISSLAQQLVLSENTSNQNTPLVKPAQNGKSSAVSDQRALPDPDNDEALILPPSAASDTSRPGLGANKNALSDRRLTSSNLDGLQKIQQDANGADRADMVRKWNTHPKEPLNLDPVDSNGVKIPPKLEKRDSEESFAFMVGSSDSQGPSFSSSFASTGSGPMQMVSGRPSRNPIGRDITNSRTEAVDFAHGQHHPMSGSISSLDNLSGRPDRGSSYLQKDFISPSNEDKLEKEGRTEDAPDLAFDPGSYPDEWGINPTVEATPAKTTVQNRSDHPVPYMSPTGPTAKDGMADMNAQKTATEASTAQNEEHIPFKYSPEDVDIDLEENKPFSLVEMLRELVSHYASKADAQSAAHLLMLLTPILPRTHPLPPGEVDATVSAYVDCLSTTGHTQEDIDRILDIHIQPLVHSGIQPLQVEAILCTYHDQLMRQRLYNEAAVLRRLSYPAFPAVYEEGLTDNSVNLKCGQCGKPMSSGMAKLKCENCHTKQASCPICWCDESPFTTETNQGAKLYTTCLLCNHSGHAACLNEWFAASGEDDGECPTQGCLCDCVPGTWRREKTKSAEKEKRRRPRTHTRVKSDDLATQESKAVVRTRAVLGVDAGKG